jgi:hypothetical protein
MSVAERAWFRLSGILGAMLRGARYSSASVSCDDGAPHVRKRRRWYAPFLVALGDPLVKLLDTGVRVLPQREWEDRERGLYRELYGETIDTDRGVLVLPHLRGETLAAILECGDHGRRARDEAIRLAAVALVALHRAGHTHGDAMAGNVLVDLDAGVARWFDFETVHDARRSITWRRADDVRALLATCLLRTPAADFDETLHLILDSCADADVERVLAASFTSGLHRPLAFHLGQAPLTFEQYGAVRRVLRARLGD